MLPIVKLIAEVYKDARTGSRVVGTSAVQLTTSDVATSSGVLIVADKDNTGTVYVSSSPDVTADTDSDNDGIPIWAGSTARVFLDNANKIYIIGDAADQKVFWGVENNF